MSATATAALELGQPAEEVKEERPDDQRLWSVTTIIGVLDKPALKWWAAEEAAKAAVSIAGTLPQRIAEDGEAEVIDWLRRAMNRRPKGRLTAAALGSCAHEACETYALTGVRPGPDELAGLVRREGGQRFGGVKAEVAVLERMLDRFDGWLQRFTPTYDATEVVVYHPEYGYAGQADAFLRIDGVRLLVDYKSSRDGFDRQGRPKSPYPEAALQIAAYRHARLAAVWRPRRIERFRRRYYLLSDAERDRSVPVPEVDGGAVIHLTPDHCEVFPVRCDEAVHERFLYVQEAARWHLEMSRDAIGLPMVEPAR
jgi:hypothetical protein